MSAIEVRHFSCHNTDLGNKRDVTVHTTGSKITLTEQDRMQCDESLWFDKKNPSCATYHGFPPKDEIIIEG